MGVGDFRRTLAWTRIVGGRMSRVILGLDCSSVAVGWATIRVADDGELTLLGSGVARIGRSPKPICSRIMVMDEMLRSVLAEFAPTEAIVETAFAGRNIQGSLRIAEVRGAAMLRLSLAGIGVSNVAPTSVKKAIAGHGMANKKAVAEAVQDFLGIDKEIETDDESDAIAIGLFAATGHTSGARG